MPAEIHQQCAAGAGAAGAAAAAAGAAAVSNDCQQPKKRAICQRCMRPQRVCLCHSLPATAIQLRGHVVILQHPIEAKVKLATVPLLAKVLSCDSLTLLVGRKLLPGNFPDFDGRLAVCRQQQVPLLVLWPGPGVLSITDVDIKQQPQQPQQPQQQPQQPLHQSHTPAAANAQLGQQQHPTATSQSSRQRQTQLNAATGTTCSTSQEQEQHLQQQQQQQQQQQRQQRPVGSSRDQPAAGPDAAAAAAAACVPPAYLLLVLDGTWRHAREMFDVLAPWLLGPAGPGLQVQLPLPASNTAAAAAPAVSMGSVVEQQQQPPAPECQEFTSGDNMQSGSSNDAAANSAAEKAAHELSSTFAALVPPSAGSGGACRLRTEPHEGCMTTYEAVAQAVACLEQKLQQQQQRQHPGKQQEAGLLGELMRPLHALTQQQAAFSPAVAARSLPGGSCVVSSKAKLGMRTRLPTPAA